MLRAEDGRSFAGSLGQLLAGLAFCAFVGFILASVITFVLWTAAGTSYIGWLGWFAAYLLVLVPALMWWERKRRPDFFGDAAGDAGGDPFSRGEYEAQEFRLKVATWATFITWGPRTLLDGLAGVRGSWPAGKLQMFDRAAQMVLHLSRHGGGVEVRQLMRPPEHMPTFTAAVDWLDRNDWLGRSSDGDRIWLSSVGRKKLAARQVLLGPGRA